MEDKTNNKEIFAENLRKQLLKRGLTQTDLTNDLKFNKSTVSDWIKAKKYPRIDRIEILAQYFGIQKSDLMEVKEDDEDDTVRKIPILGAIACGKPIFADENIEGYAPISASDDVDFALRAKGDSMNKSKIDDGDIVFIRKQSIVDNGEIAAVIIDDEATIKRFYRYGDTVVLKPDSTNKIHQELIYENYDLDHIRIIGKVIFAKILLI